MLAFFLLLLCVLIFSTADYFAAKWGSSRDGISLAVVLIVGPFAYLLFGYLASSTSLSKMGGYVNSGIILCTALAGIIFLGERPNKITFIGLAIIITGITLLSFGKVDGSDSTSSNNPLDTTYEKLLD